MQLMAELLITKDTFMLYMCTASSRSDTQWSGLSFSRAARTKGAVVQAHQHFQSMAYVNKQHYISIKVPHDTHQRYYNHDNRIVPF